MAFILLLLAVIATTSSVLADNYTFTQRCDGTVDGKATYCVVDGIGEHDIGYYDIQLISDDTESGEGCQTWASSYELVSYNSMGAIRVNAICNGTFGIKPKVSGYPYTGSCGQDNSEGFKIINGNETDECQFPWMAFVKQQFTYSTSCGGSIVGDRWILTAAHCIIQLRGDGSTLPASALYVRTGSLDKDANYIQREVDMVVTHPSYETKTHRYDIGLLRLSAPIRWDGCHAPLCLNSDTNIDTNLKCKIAGWGSTSARQFVIPEKMLFADERMLTRAKCDEIYGQYSTNTTICVEASSASQGFCTGDSGGPLFCKSNEDGRYYQHAIASVYLGGKSCKGEALYTSVASLYDWIKSYVE